MKTIANWLVTQREKLGLTQNELGELVGCSQQRLQNYEKDKRCPDLDLLTEFAKIFQSELRIGINGIQAISSDETVVFATQTLGELLTSNGYDASLIEATQQVLESKIKPLLQGIHSPEIGFQLGGHRLAINELRALKDSPFELSLLGRDLDRLAEEIIRTYESTQEDCYPHELGGLGDFGCEVIFQTTNLEASLTVSLLSEATSQRSWKWYLFSEVDGVVDDVVFSAPYESLSGSDVVLTLLEKMEDVLSLPTLHDFVREHCQTQLLEAI